MAAKQAAPVVPIVFAAVGDPVGVGFVASLARPGGNVTGVSSLTADLAGKRLDLLREAISNLGRLAIMGNVGNPIVVLELGELQAAAVRSDSSSTRLKSDGRRILRPPWTRLKAARTHSMSVKRPGYAGQPAAHQHLGAGRAPAGDARLSGVHRSGGPNILRTELPGFVPARVYPLPRRG
jgi:ABC transporter substrate binding protein